MIDENPFHLIGAFPGPVSRDNLEKAVMLMLIARYTLRGRLLRSCQSHVVCETHADQ